MGNMQTTSNKDDTIEIVDKIECYICKDKYKELPTYHVNIGNFGVCEKCAITNNVITHKNLMNYKFDNNAKCNVVIIF